MSLEDCEQKKEVAIEEYKAIKPLHEEFSKRLSELLIVILDQNGIKYHAIEHRAKSVSSFREKLGRPGKQYNSPLEDLPDLSGVRIIGYYADDVERIRKIIESEFNIQKATSGDKLDDLAPHEFGYRSVHCIIKLNNSRSILPEWDKFRDLKAEIQLRSVLQHAWAAISHTLQYKHESEVPKSLRRRLFRLAGLMELADEEFATVRDEHQSLSNKIEQSQNEEIAEFTVDRLTLKKYIMESVTAQNVKSSAIKAGYGSFEDDQDLTLPYLAWVCSRAEISSIAQLDENLRSVSEKSTEYFILAKGEAKWVCNIPFFISMLLIGKHKERFSVDLLSENGLPTIIARKILNAAKILKNS